MPDNGAIMIADKAYPALVLNADYSPYAILPWREAVPRVLRKVAYPVENYDRKISSEKETMNLPSVIALTRYISLDKPARLTRNNIYIAFEMRCAYCGHRFHSSELNIDHLHPRSRGGNDTWSNLLLSCVAHNQAKGDRTLKELGWTLKIHPKNPTQRDIIQSSLRLGMSNPQPQWKSYLDHLYWDSELEAT